MSKRKKLTRRQLIGGIAIAGASAAGGAGTYAYITDNETAKVSFQSGSIVLQISPEVIDFTAGTPTGGEDNQQDDGDEMLTTITLQNAGTLPAKRLAFDGLTLTGNEDLKNNAKVTTLNIIYPDGTTADALDPSTNVDYTVATDIDNNNGFLDLADIATHLSAGTLSILSSSYTLQPLQDNQVQIELGITYQYANITSNGETLEADFDFVAKQDV